MDKRDRDRDRDREKEIKIVLDKLEQLASRADEETDRLKEKYGVGEEYWTQEAYASGIYEAYALCKKAFED